VIDGLDLRVLQVPTPAPEADGTASWSATGVLVVLASAGGTQGLGWAPCAAPAAARVVRDLLAPHVLGADPMSVPATWSAMAKALRNAGRPGLGMMALSAVDAALWDLKARLLDLPLDALLGRARDSVTVYGSGGFVSLTDDELREQLRYWTQDLGVPAVKIKVGEDWGRATGRDLQRTALARQCVGESVELFVDANGGYAEGQARRIGHRYDELGVTWFEEPVSSADVAGLTRLRAALRCDVAAGEYVDGLEAAALLCGAVDCLQLDATRCGGPTGFLRAAAVAQAHGLEVSAHCAPSMHLHAGLACPNLRHAELFIDHERLEKVIFDGVAGTEAGSQRSTGAAGNGLTLSERAGVHVQEAMSCA
jgi:L-alanine-DL-glutamate epimerase-like enolase superfamily enzyme